jgi:hypothetical protein
MVIEVICLTTSGELTRSITLLCTRISNLSQVLVPDLPQQWSQYFLFVIKNFSIMAVRNLMSFKVPNFLGAEYKYYVQFLSAEYKYYV